VFFACEMRRRCVTCTVCPHVLLRLWVICMVAVTGVRLPWDGGRYYYTYMDTCNGRACMGMVAAVA
jgi:hypothetical protein